MIVDATEALRLLSEKDDGDRKLAVPSVDTEPRLSNTLVWSPSISGIGFLFVTWKRARGGSEPKTCTGANRSGSQANGSKKKKEEGARWNLSRTWCIFLALRTFMARRFSARGPGGGSTRTMRVSSSGASSLMVLNPCL